jgi:serine/threonine protein kinase
MPGEPDRIPGAEIVLDDVEFLRQRAREVAGIQLTGALRVLRDTSNFMAIDRGDVLDLAGHPYLVCGNEREGRFGIDDQPKYWVKRAVSLLSGRVYVVKLVFHESFSTGVHGEQYPCERSAEKEAQVLEAVRGHPNFMHGRAIPDEGGNLVRVIDFIEGKSLLAYLGGLAMTHEEYVEQALPRVLAEAHDCFAGIAYLHGLGLCHGDIRNDHILLDDQSGWARWIDFDYTRPSLEFDVWSLGNVLNCVLAKGFVTFHGLRRSHPELLEQLTEEDASAFFRHRLMNVDRVYPHLPQCLARMLRRFAVGKCARYERAEQVVDELGACMHGLGWWRRDRPRGPRAR